MAIRMLGRGDVVHVAKGDHFGLLLSDGTLLQVEQTADDFSITLESGKDANTVCYTRPVSEMAKAIDGKDGERELVTGRG